MYNQPTRMRYAYGGVRVSSKEQGLKDSPQAQMEQINRYAEHNNIVIIDFIKFYESGSKKDQPMQRAIDQIKHDKRVELFIVKSIDRFTRGGFKPYGDLKEQLEKLDIGLIDTFGVIGNQKINTLEYLGLEYDWSVYSPTLKSELLAAEQSRDEIRDIMSRMIGAQIRYCRMGYWVRGDIYGMKCKKIVTSSGKRTILVPHKIEATLVQKMFQLRAEGKFTDQEIIEQMNTLGFKTHTQYLRDKTDPSRITGKRGGEPLVLKSFLRIINNPVYAGITCEKWTEYKPLRLKFDGIISIDLFNRANKGKFTIHDADGELKFLVNKDPARVVKSDKGNTQFPYKRVVTCPHCGKQLHASSSRGKLGKYYPAYHCRRDGHNFRVPLQEFEDTITAYVQSLQVNTAYLQDFTDAIRKEWDRRSKATMSETDVIEEQIKNLAYEARQSMDKIKFLNSETAIKYIEEELMRIEGQIDQLKYQKTTLKVKQPVEIEDLIRYTKYFFEHLDLLLLQQSNPIAKANFFSLIFNNAPSFSDLDIRTPENKKTTEVSDVFLALLAPNNHVAG
ncbi:hypothetical protein EOL96_06170, partial [Candidatus Saccharibacteria bacterium]|nr:hypothetical protein [Candidatus Saccharibacteria bacterium]